MHQNINNVPIIIGIRGLANLEECTIGAPHLLDAFNLLTGLYFLIAFAAIMSVLYFMLKYPYGTKSNIGIILGYLIVLLLVVSVIVGFCDIAFSFYIANQVYGQLHEFQRDQVKCSSPVYFSSFVSVMIILLHIPIVIVLAVFLALFLFFCLNKNFTSGLLLF